MRILLIIEVKVLGVEVCKLGSRGGHNQEGFSCGEVSSFGADFAWIENPVSTHCR
jgi:hypothetical protein